MFLTAAALLAGPAAAQTPPAAPGASEKAREASAKARQAETERARARCRAERGVDCETDAGLHEWQLQERSRSEAVREGSRHRLPR